MAARWQIDAGDAAAIEALVGRVRAAGDVVACAGVHHGNFPTLEYVADGLRAAGRKTLGIYLLTAPPEGRYDFSFGCGGSLARFSYLLALLPPGVLYLQAHGRWAFLSQLVAAVAPGRAVVQEMYDWMELFVPRAHEAAFLAAGLFAPGELALVRHAERFVRTRAAAFVYKDGGPGMAALLASARVPSAQILPCPPRAWQRAPKVRAEASADDEGRTQVRLVHAGQLRGREAPRAVFGDLQLLPLVQGFTTQGFEVTAYAGATADANAYARLYGDYAAEAARNPRFRLEPHRPLRALIEALHGQFDFGLLTYPFDDDLLVGRDHLRGAVASKLFTYLAAGLPVLVSRELEHMAALVQRWGVGLVLAREDLSRLDTVLRAVDRRALVAAVARAQPTLSFEGQLPDLLALFDRVAPTAKAP